MSRIAFMVHGCVVKGCVLAGLTAAATGCREPAAKTTNPATETSSSSTDATTGSADATGAADGTGMPGTGSSDSSTGSTAPGIDVQAHRGDRANVPPGNTIPAFVAALELGVDTLEGDMQITSDARVVMGHDDDLLVTGCVLVGAPSIPSLISQMTIDEVAQWDCHPEIDGVQSPPPVEDVFDLDADIAFNFELKRLSEADADIYLPTLVAYDRGCGGCLQGRLTVQSFAWPTLRHVYDTYHRDGAGTLAFDLSLLGVAVALDTLPDAAAWADIVSPSFETVDATLVETAHDLGLRVIPWTVDDPDQMQAQIDLGVDGIITNDPTALLQLLGRL